MIKMIRLKIRNLSCFLIGILLGGCIYRIVSRCLVTSKLREDNFEIKSNEVELYEHHKSDKLFNEVKVLCWIMIAPKYHKTRGVHIKNTWGKRCNKLLFMSSAEDPELDTIALPGNEGLQYLWPKTKEAFKYIHENHLNEADWFMKADDDAYMIMENVRHLLYQYRPQTALYFGHRFVGNKSLNGYMQGGAYILSRKAVEKFVKLAPSCPRRHKGYAEDLYLGKVNQTANIPKKSRSLICDLTGNCLTNTSIFVDTRDNFEQARFLMFGVERYYKIYGPDDWFVEKAFYDVRRDTLDCCSDTPVGFHYIKNVHEIFLLEYLIYNVHPFGRDKNSTEALPEKLTLSKILAAADVPSNSPFYIQHKIVHDMESSEIF